MGGDVPRAIELRFKAEGFSFDVWLDRGENFGDGIRRRKALVVKLDVPGFDLAQIEDLINQFQKVQ